MEQSTPHSLAQPARRRTWRSYAAGLIILLCGIVIGIGIGARASRLRDPLALLQPDTVPARVARILKWQLGLSSEQSSKILEIFERKRVEIDAVRAKILPEMDPILEDLRQQVEATLTPEQAKAWNRQYNELRDKWRPMIPATATK